MAGTLGHRARSGDNPTAGDADAYAERISGRSPGETRTEVVMTDPVKRTPEEEAVQKQIEDLGLKDETIVDGEGGEPTPATPAAPAAPAAPATPAAPVAAAPATPAAPESGTLREWAEAEQARANTERGRAEGLEAENKRLRGALQTPETASKNEAEENAFTWVEQALKSPRGRRVIGELISELPEDLLDKHPTIRKRDMAIYMTRDEIAQTQFLGRFEPKQRPVVQKRVLPILKTQRQASGFQDTYDDLYDKYAQGIKEQAELVGLVVTEPGAAPAPSTGHPPTPPGPIPPSLSGVRGVSGPVGPTAEPLSVEDARVLGLA